MNKVKVLSYIFELATTLIYLFDAWRFYDQHDIHAGVSALIFLILSIDVRNRRDK